MVGASPLNHLVAPQMALVERSWHLLTVLLRFGRPVSAPQLESRCLISSSPGFIKFLCGIPGSPLLLTDDGFVTLSTVAMESFLAFFSNSVTPFVPRDRRVSAQMRACGNVTVMYSRKRKDRLLEDAIVVDLPRAKRMLLVPNRGDLEELVGNKESTDQLSLATKEALQINFMLPGDPNNTLTVGSIVNESPQMILNKNHPSPMEINCTMDACVNLYCNKVQKDGLDEVLPDFQCFKRNCFGIDVNASISEEIMPKGMLVSKSLVDEPDFQLTSRDLLMDRPVQLENEAEMPIEKDSQPSALLPAIPLPVISDNPTFICQALGPTQDTEATEILYCQSGGASVGIGSSKESPEEHSVAEQTSGMPEPSGACLPADFEPVNNQQSKIFMESHTTESRSLFVGLRDSNSPIVHQTNGSAIRKNRDKMDPKHLVKKENVNICNNDAVNKAIPVPKSPKSQLESKSQPNLESFIIEEEEGSGGYGTVYRARRKTDGKVFAVKCPHTNAHAHHVNNEMKMLERFGGKNFVIKYEGSFRSGNSECFVLEHVEHDRPEFLKKEITITELQWYGFCMFKALASLHKQGIAHRDVKPGNFLFSRRLKKGYLIDFNLASDLHQKFIKDNNNENDNNTKLEPVPLANTKSTLLKQSRRVIKDEILGNGSKETANDLKKNHPSKGLKKRCEGIPLNALAKIDNIKRGGNQAADVSGVTSAKDPTSTKTPTDKLKQPIPYKGRKELINFLHETMHAPNQKGSTVPAAQRKRVAAPLGKMDRRLVMLTPMPLHFGGSAVAGAGMYNKRNGKHKREGPCVGTKGFRAPEALFKSIHQGCKVDIWSAGVTLLYLMIGKTPFGGDPEQNIKDIAKLRGSEDLWEVAKLHNSESCFPQELFDVQYLRSLGLREWCLLNTRRPEFIKTIPHSLFDLINKCLTVNPRCRVNAEEALMHDFFAPCHESLRKQRTLRRETILVEQHALISHCTGIQSMLM